MMNVLRVILSGVAAKDPGQTPRVILGGPALPRRHALFYGPVPGLSPVPHLVKPSRSPLGVIPALEPESSLAAPVSALACNDRCRETLEEAA